MPARAYDNVANAVFSNPIGMDDNQLKNGFSMVLDLFGDVVAECRELTVCSQEKLEMAGGFRFCKAMRPKLYGHSIGKEHGFKLVVAWTSME